MIVGLRQWHKRTSRRVANDQPEFGDDGSDAMELKPEPSRERGDALIVRWRGGEAQFVIVASREQTLERDVVRRARELPVKRLRARNRGQLEHRAHLRCFENMPEVADQAVRDV